MGLKRKSTPSPSYRILGLAAVVLAVAGGAYFWYAGRYPSWDEEVRLADGRAIWIEQKHDYYENHGTTQSWVTFSLPEMGGKRTWHSQLTPQRVDVHDGKVYVFGFPRGDRQYSYYNFPRHYMVAFVWSGNEFRRIPFLEVPQPLRLEENIISCLPKRPISRVSISEKQGWWCAPKGDKQQFGKKIDLAEYQSLAASYSRRSGGTPRSD